MRFNRRKTAGYRYLSILTQAGETLKSGLLFLVPIAPKEKTNLFLGKKLAIFVYITRYALVGWLLSQSVGLMLFTAFFTVNYYWLMVGAASSIRSKNKAKGDQKSFGFIVKLVRQLAGILKPTRVMNVMDAMALMASVAFVMEVASMSSVLSAFILGACFCGIVSAKVL
ncbi:MAG: hypothetical protein VXW87_02140, partial [Pseudomonadota bacterium]|nr:hypothetical protein [Pseudomonadota bacterium]